MYRTLIATTALTLTLALLSSEAQAGGGLKDRIEDRIDRRESIRDERVDHGRWDVIEDRIDRRESRRDRAGLTSPRFVHRWERRSWKRRWGG